MNKNELALKLLAAIKDLLTWAGIPRDMLDGMDEAIFLIFIIAVSLVIAAVIHFILAQLARRILKRRKIGVLGSMLRYGVFRKLTAVIPPLIVSALLPFAFDHRSHWFIVSDRVTWICFFLALLFSINAIFRTVGDALMQREEWKNRPLKGFIQIFQVIFTCITLIIIGSIIAGKSPSNLITGLGAFAAVLMLIFKDTILGFVAGVMISEDDMLRIGDWIEMPQNNINGTVTDISLDIVKVLNFDNTTVTIPPYSLVSGSFINWRTMEESGGRRIMREYVLKLDGIRTCTPDFLEGMKSFDPLLRDYITAKQRQAAEGRTANTANPEGLPDGTIDTNAGLLRAYMYLYLSHHPAVNHSMLTMVRTLAPTENGLPMQIYCFSANTDWASYESIQSEIMEHFVTVLPAFGLSAFQNADSRDMILGSLIESPRNDLPDNIDGVAWRTMLGHGGTADRASAPATASTSGTASPSATAKTAATPSSPAAAAAESAGGSKKE